MLSRTRTIFFVAVVAITLCLPGFAQVYPPGTPTPTGTSTTPGTPGYTPPSGGYKANPALIGGLIGGGGAAAAGIWYFMHHRNVVRGCVGPDGKTLVADKDGKTFQLSSSLTPGERVSLKAKKDENEANSSTLQVEDVRKDYGRCEQAAKGQ
jgi:hypothetical protein